MGRAVGKVRVDSLTSALPSVYARHSVLNRVRGSIIVSTCGGAHMMRTLVHLSDTHILPTDADRLQGVDTLQNVRDILQVVERSGLQLDALVVFQSGQPWRNRQLPEMPRNIWSLTPLPRVSRLS